MKVIAILEGNVAVGGGFNQALNAILQMQRICEGRFDFEVFTTHKVNKDYLQQLGVATELFSFSIIDKLLSRLSLNPWWQALQSRLELMSLFERKLLKQGCDLVYFVTPSGPSSALQRLNYIFTLWDLCHRDSPEFPEVREFVQFQVREHHYKTRLSPSLIILTDSAALADSTSRRYGIDRERILPMPFAPAPFLDAGLAKDKSSVLRKYELDEGYFFYPAQFWAHKNHIRILEALVILRGRGRRLKVVFAGGDQGNRSHVEKFVDDNALSEQVRFLGFVPTQNMRGLYEGCAVVVMPTYFGPTNMPPLEAWTIAKPLIYSSHLKEQVGEAAICVNPDDANELAEGMLTSTDPETCANLVELGTLRLRELDQMRTDAELELLSRLHQFEARRRCWA